MKIIHRIFFGFGGEEDLYRPYLEQWKRALPHYEIRLWNATNLPLDLNPWTKKMTELQDGVFLSDFFRWWVCREYGGVYLDADIEIYDGEKFDTLMYELENSSEYDAFIGVETSCGGYTAHSFACKKDARIAQYMCKLYENLDCLSVARKSMLMAPRLTNLYFWENGVGKNGVVIPSNPQIEASVKIYPIDFFSPIQYGMKPSLEYLSSRTCLAHHYGDSWVEDECVLSVQRDKMKETLLQKRPKLVNDYLEDQNKVAVFLKKRIRSALIWLIGKVILPLGSQRREWVKSLFKAFK